MNELGRTANKVDHLLRGMRTGGRCGQDLSSQDQEMDYGLFGIIVDERKKMDPGWMGKEKDYGFGIMKMVKSNGKELTRTGNLMGQRFYGMRMDKFEDLDLMMMETKWEYGPGGTRLEVSSIGEITRDTIQYSGELVGS
tara:strand:- start:67 stop:483 length:417 start_codon:yes stop_codon:yes gene_type:complete